MNTENCLMYHLRESDLTVYGPYSVYKASRSPLIMLSKPEITLPVQPPSGNIVICRKTNCSLRE